MYHQAMTKLHDDSMSPRPVHQGYVPRHEQSELEAFVMKEAEDITPSTSVGDDEKKDAHPPENQLYDDPQGGEQAPDETGDQPIRFSSAAKERAREEHGDVLKRILKNGPSQDVVQRAIVSSQLDAAARGEYETSSSQLQAGSKRMEQTKTSAPLAPTLSEQVRRALG